MNHQVLSADLMNDATAQSRFRNDDPGSDMSSSQSMDYRHVPLMDLEEDRMVDNSAVPIHVQQNLVI
jgi:hypothetical protein